MSVSTGCLPSIQVQTRAATDLKVMPGADISLPRLAKLCLVDGCAAWYSLISKYNRNIPKLTRLADLTCSSLVFWKRVRPATGKVGYSPAGTSRLQMKKMFALCLRTIDSVCNCLMHMLVHAYRESESTSFQTK